MAKCLWSLVNVQWSPVPGNWFLVNKWPNVIGQLSMDMVNGSYFMVCHGHFLVPGGHFQVLYGLFWVHGGHFRVFGAFPGFLVAIFGFLRPFFGP